MSYGTGDPDLLLMLIYHHDTMTINDLATHLNPKMPKLQHLLSRHFFTELLDFGIYPDNLAKARAKTEDTIEIPESATSPAASETAASGPEATAETSAPQTGALQAERRLDHQRSVRSGRCRPAGRLPRSSRRLP